MRSSPLLTRAARALLAAGACCAPFLAPAAAPRAQAQVADAEPYYIEVQRDNVYLRCGDGTVWYAIAQVDADAVLRVDGEGFDWLRVAFPDGVGALVRADEGALDAQRAVVRLTRPSKLRYYNRDNGVVNSWKTLLDQPLPAGEELRHLDTLRDEAGQPVGFLVEAPDEARAFISQQLTNRISEEEALARLGRNDRDDEQQPARAESPAPEQPAQTAAAPREEPAPTETARSTDESTAPQPEQAAPIEPTSTNEPAPEQPAEPADETTDEPAERPVDQTAATNEAAPSPPSDPAPVLTMGDADEEPPGRRALTLEELQEAFDRVIAEPILEAEIQPLINGHRELLESLEGDASAESVRAYLRTRIDLLEIRLDLQRQMERVRQIRSRAEQDAESIQSRVAEWRQRPEYLFIGRLAPSAIYDGKRLPLLYRLLSVEDAPGRTIAYIAPDESLDLNAKLGAIVGVVGAREGRGALRAQVVTPERVDVLNP